MRRKIYCILVEKNLLVNQFQFFDPSESELILKILTAPIVVTFFIIFLWQKNNNESQKTFLILKKENTVVWNVCGLKKNKNKDIRKKLSKLKITLRNVNGTRDTRGVENSKQIRLKPPATLILRWPLPVRSKQSKAVKNPSLAVPKPLHLHVALFLPNNRSTAAYLVSIYFYAKPSFKGRSDQALVEKHQVKFFF